MVVVAGLTGVDQQRVEASGPIDQLQHRMVHQWRLVTGHGATLGAGHVPALVRDPDPSGVEVTGGLRDLPGALVTTYILVMNTVQHVA